MALLVLALARVEGVLSQRRLVETSTAVCLIAHVTSGGSSATAVENSLELGSRSTVPFAISSFNRASRGSDLSFGFVAFCALSHHSEGTKRETSWPSER